MGIYKWQKIWIPAFGSAAITGAGMTKIRKIYSYVYTLYNLYYYLLRTAVFLRFGFAALAGGFAALRVSAHVYLILLSLRFSQNSRSHGVLARLRAGSYNLGMRTPKALAKFSNSP